MTLTIRFYRDGLNNRAVHDTPECQVIARLNEWKILTPVDPVILDLNLGGSIDDYLSKLPCDSCGKILRGER